MRRRVERLQERGIIRFAMIAEASQLGYDIGAMIGLRVDLARLTEIGERLARCPRSSTRLFLTGSFDIMVQIVVESQDALVQFLMSVAGIDACAVSRHS